MCCSRLPMQIKITSQLKCVYQTGGQRERGTNGHKQLFHDTTSVLGQKVRLRPRTGKGLMSWYMSAGITLLLLMDAMCVGCEFTSLFTRTPFKALDSRPLGHTPRSSSQGWGWPGLPKHFVACGPVSFAFLHKSQISVSWPGKQPPFVHNQLKLPATSTVIADVFDS